MTGESILKILKNCGCDVNFEDLAIPLTVVATNIDTATEKRFDSGSVLDAVRCSMGIPGIFAPHQLDDGQHYVDGVFVNNLPANCLSADSVVAVSTLGIGAFEPESSRSLL
jgi:NTE family protein